LQSLARARPLVVALVAIRPSFIVSHLSYECGNYLPNSFLGYLFDGEKGNSIALDVE
jgi:hypothetical protein